MVSVEIDTFHAAIDNGENIIARCPWQRATQATTQTENA